MFGGIRNLDDQIRGYMAKQAEAQLQARRQAVMDDLTSMASANTAGAAGRIGAGYIQKDSSGAGRAALEDLLRTGMNTRAHGPGDARSLIEATAGREARQNPLYNLQRMLSGDSGMDRAGQVAFYGGAAGGTVAGLTAAGQGLMALMDYLQQGQVTQAERENELV